MGVRFYYADVVTETIAPAGGGAPEVSIPSVDRVGMGEMSEEEIKAVPEFPLIYSVLKRLADAKALEKWPEIQTQQ